MKNLITEQFLTIQGEGKSLGRPAYFIRFAGCNLWCAWCDSMHSVDPRLFQETAHEIDFSLIPDHCELIVLTGGEPTLFDLKSVREKLISINSKRVFEVESNATNFPVELLVDFHWNLSPKLKSSSQKTLIQDQMRLRNLKAWADYSQTHDNVTFKFVITNTEDLSEVSKMVEEYSISKNRVYLMAEGRTESSQQLSNVEWLIEECKNLNFNFSPRLHIMLWGEKLGV